MTVGSSAYDKVVEVVYVPQRSETACSSNFPAKHKRGWSDFQANKSLCSVRDSVRSWTLSSKSCVSLSRFLGEAHECSTVARAEGVGFQLQRG